MNRLGVVLSLAAVTACHGAPVAPAPAVSWTHGYIVSPAPGSPAVAYLWLTNSTSSADTVTEVRVGGADSAQVHENMPTGNGMENMERVVALAVPAHDTLRLAPGGYHVMVFGIRGTLRAGDSTAVTVTFTHAGDVAGWARVITYADVDSLAAR
ncbi:MAG TPA: copper chaperone PCu(A)C [Gemmatimonadaceae bacterium]